MVLTDRLLLLFALVLDSCLAVILLRQRRHEEFPFFFIYVASCMVIMTVRLSVMGNYAAYFNVFWASEPIEALLILLALHEAFRKVFLPFYQFWWFWFVFPGAVAIISGFVVSAAIQHPPAAPSLRIAVILSSSKSIHYVEAGLFGVFFLLVWLLGLRWQNYPFGIVMGFAAVALGAGYSFAARSAFGTKFNTLAKYGPAMAYILAVAIWLIVFLLPSAEQIPTEGTNTIRPEQVLREVRQYTRVLKGFFGKHQ
ncbi:MAG TPA: hypothetical protein VI636_20305 [Candidatus Angelobacter sp.]